MNSVHETNWPIIITFFILRPQEPDKVFYLDHREPDKVFYLEPPDISYF